MASLTISPEEQKRVKALGFLANKGTDEFSARIITVNGKISAKQLQCIAEAAEKYGDGTITFTSRLTIECPGVPFDKIEDFREYIAKEGLLTGGTGSKIRPVVSCKGTTCQYGLVDTFDVTEEIHNEFYLNWHDVLTPHKFKIGMSGCPNSCIKPDLNDLGIIGQLEPNYDPEMCMGCARCSVEEVCPMDAAKVVDGKLEIDKELCNNCGLCVGKCHFDAIPDGETGYKVTLGGMWGKRKNQGKPISKMLRSKEEIMDVIEKTMLIYREQGDTGERLADTLERIGFEEFEKQLYNDEILERKEEILAAKLHVKGGATC